MVNPVFTYILNIWFVNTVFRYTQLKDPVVLFLKLIIALVKVKWFQILICITNNWIEHQSFVHTDLNDQTVGFQRIQFSISLHSV